MSSQGISHPNRDHARQKGHGHKHGQRKFREGTVPRVNHADLITPDIPEQLGMPGKVSADIRSAPPMRMTMTPGTHEPTGTEG